jgi:hypothetical protein
MRTAKAIAERQEVMALLRKMKGLALQMDEED